MFLGVRSIVGGRLKGLMSARSLTGKVPRVVLETEVMELLTKIYRQGRGIHDFWDLSFRNGP